MRIASPRRPCASRMSAIAIAQPKISAMCPARRSPAAHSAHAGCAASRSPLPQNASPRRPAAEARTRWSSSGARSSVRRACLTCRAARPGPGPWRHGTARSPPGGGGIPPRWPRPSRPAGLGIPHRYPRASSHRSASRSRTSTPSSSPADSNAQATAKMSTGLTRTISSGSASSQLCTVASCLVLAHGRNRPLDQVRCPPKSSAASAWPMATDGSPFRSYHALARRCRSGTWPGCSSSSRACSTSAKRWW